MRFGVGGLVWFLSYVYGCFICIQVYVSLVCPESPEEGIKLLGTRVIDSYELLLWVHDYYYEPGTHIGVLYKNSQRAPSAETALWH